jgi:hypothetical protein
MQKSQEFHLNNNESVTGLIFWCLRHVLGECLDVSEGHTPSIVKQQILVNVDAEVMHPREPESVTLKMSTVRSSETSKYPLHGAETKKIN